MEVLSFRDADISCQQWGHSELRKCHFSFKEEEGKKKNHHDPKDTSTFFAARIGELKWQELFHFWWVLMRPSAYSHFPQDAEIVISAIVWKTMSKLLWIFLIIFFSCSLNNTFIETSSTFLFASCKCQFIRITNITEIYLIVFVLMFYSKFKLIVIPIHSISGE